MVDLQGRRESNPQPPVLETGALPVELLPSGSGSAGNSSAVPVVSSKRESAAVITVLGREVERQRFQRDNDADGG